jgi:hypothetical protein
VHFGEVVQLRQQGSRINDGLQKDTDIELFKTVPAFVPKLIPVASDKIGLKVVPYGWIGSTSKLYEKLILTLVASVTRIYQLKLGPVQLGSLLSYIIFKFSQLLTA